jgi:hypothetical protein
VAVDDVGVSLGSLGMPGTARSFSWMWDYSMRKASATREQPHAGATLRRRQMLSSDDETLHYISSEVGPRGGAERKLRQRRAHHAPDDRSPTRPPGLIERGVERRQERPGAMGMILHPAQRMALDMQRH